MTMQSCSFGTGVAAKNYTRLGHGEILKACISVAYEFGKRDAIFRADQVSCRGSTRRRQLIFEHGGNLPLIPRFSVYSFPFVPAMHASIDHGVIVMYEAFEQNLQRLRVSAQHPRKLPASNHDAFARFDSQGNVARHSGESGHSNDFTMHNVRAALPMEVQHECISNLDRR